MFLRPRIQLVTLLLVAILWGCLTIPACGEEGDGVPIITHSEEIPTEKVAPDEGGQKQQHSENQDELQQQSENNYSSDKGAWGTARHHEQHGHEEEGRQHQQKEESIDYQHQQQHQQQQQQDREQAGRRGNKEHHHSQDEVPEVPMEKNASHPSTTPFGEKMHGNANSNAAGGHLPFVHHHPTSHFIPPEGFAITARVYTDPSDKLAHFTDDAEGTHITLPYWECGATGSTTSPLPVKHAYFRHALSGSKPQVWSGTEYGPHPQLVVALKRMEMTLNSGETKQLKPGDVVLLEDVVSGGHKLTSLENEFDMTYLLLTLPQHYHHVGKDRFSLKQASTTKQKSPCSNNWNLNVNQQQQQQHDASTSGGAFVNKADSTRHQTQQMASSSSSSFSWDTATSGDIAPASPLREGRTRKLLLGAVGVSLSTLMADFLGKVAPLWVAVGIGGTCFVVGGTTAFIKGGEYVVEELEMWQERKRLDAPVYQGDDDEEEEEHPERQLKPNHPERQEKEEPTTEQTASASSS